MAAVLVVNEYDLPDRVKAVEEHLDSFLDELEFFRQLERLGKRADTSGDHERNILSVLQVQLIADKFPERFLKSGIAAVNYDHLGLRLYSVVGFFIHDALPGFF